jgi:hypothetical protein
VIFGRAAAATWPPFFFWRKDAELGRLLQLVDWTGGSIAFTASGMDEIQAIVADRPPIETRTNP